MWEKKLPHPSRTLQEGWGSFVIMNRNDINLPLLPRVYGGFFIFVVDAAVKVVVHHVSIRTQKT